MVALRARPGVTCLVQTRTLRYGCPSPPLLSSHSGVLEFGDGSAWKRDPFQESGLHLSPTAAEAKEKARATRVNKRAPQMDWNRKREIFSNF
ncbi:hypothetical protein P7K49_022812 [Saguinus oedipus]|uniref:EBP50 C-terminal domain-containing protein n=1 Tax=Saguinus oedipus TaxID=9490 RepID=A0ABQ9UJW2_SAGOE|nr:hypothetical protein P7K49_022812 [Saguinus oedipus]